MDEIKIEDIKSAGNPRKDLGDLTELTASIKAHGVIVPIVLNKKGELTAGHRRIAAAKAAGLKTVPYVTKDDADDFAVAMAENLHRKDLNPVEEGQAYQEHMKKAKMTVKGIAGAIGKTEAYVQKRLDLLNAIPDVQKALAEGKIMLGHAVILGRLDEDKQGEKLKGLLKDRPSVTDFAESISGGWDRATKDLSDACFDKKECANCPNNGGCQAILTEAGTTLKNSCLKPSCFDAKVKAYLENEKKKLEDKGVKIVDVEKIHISNSAAEDIREWDTRYKKAAADLTKHPEKYAVGLILTPNGKVSKKIYILNKGARINGDRIERDSPEKEAEKQLKVDRKERLESGVRDYKHDLMVAVTRELALKVPNAHDIKALTVYQLVRDSGYGADDSNEKEIEKILPEFNPDMKEILKLKEPQLDRLLVLLSPSWLGSMDETDLEEIANSLGFDIQKHFKMDEAYLEMHSIEQLQSLAKELGVDTEAQKKTELVNAILDAKPKKVPKAIVDAKPERAEKNY